MTFVSLTYLLLCLGVIFPYFLARTARTQNIILLLASYTFYAWWDYRFCSLLLFSSGLDFVCGRKIASSEGPQKKRWLMLSLSGNLGLLCFFKYFNFFLGSLAALLQSMGLQANIETLSILLPVGISFYTFQTLSYSIDIYRGQMEPVDSMLELLTFVSFFPPLVAGPIERARQLLPQFSKPREFDSALARDGMRQMLWGLFKKVCVADVLAWTIGNVYDSPAAFSGPVLLFVTVLFAFQIYADFSGYSDIAIGSAKVLGLRLTQNFNAPYFAVSLKDFWRRWHITLSTWFRDYVYIPLGGSRTSPGRVRVNLLATFLLSGLWHGANWTFVIWGAIHGLVLVLEREFGERKNKVVGWFVTMLVVSLSWVFFRANTLGDAITILQRIAVHTFSPDQWGSVFTFISTWTDTRRGLAAIVLVLILDYTTRHKQHPFQNWQAPLPARWLVYTIFFWWIVVVTPVQHSPFIYFQF